MTDENFLVCGPRYLTHHPTLGPKKTSRSAGSYLAERAAGSPYVILGKLFHLSGSQIHYVKWR